MAKTAHGEARPEGAHEGVSKAFQSEAWAGGGCQGRVRTAIGRRYAHAKGERTYRALLEVVVENVNAIAVVVVRAGRPVRGKAVVRVAAAATTTAATTAAVAAAAAAVTAVTFR